MSALARAVAALEEVNRIVQNQLNLAIDSLDECVDDEERRGLDRHIDRLVLIQKPTPFLGPDIYKGMPTRRVEASAWAGIITNPGAFCTPMVEGGGYRRSVYLDTDGADSHGVHAADLE